eukprot:454437-Alexandrium_andersonii.AAC.1
MLGTEFASRETAHQFWQVLTWSFRCLYAGRWPEEDHRGRQYVRGDGGFSLAGKPLAKGCLAAFNRLVCVVS